MSNDTDAPSPLDNFSWPFPKTDTSASGETSSSDVTDPRDYYEALALAEDGFYPIGANGQWHGGIHFGRQTGTRLDQDNGIRCIADGEVIAWKIDETYPTVEYDTCGSAKYSTGFVLVRHRMALPAVPAGDDSDNRDPAAADTQQSDADDPTLLFYSLYIHLLDWQGYRQNPDTPRPAFWGEGAYAVGDGATDADRNRNPHIPENGIGLNLRNAANTIVGFAPQGTQLRLGQEGRTRGYFTVTEVVSGAVVPPGLTDFYAFRGEMTAVPTEPDTKGTVVIPEVPIPIAAGTLVGHLGEYKRYVDAGAMCSDDPRPLAQIDVFTTEDIEAFIEASRNRAAQLPDSSKTLLVVDEGAQLAVPAGAGETPSVEQLAAARSAGGGPVADYIRVIPIKALDAVTEEDGTRWWPVDVGTQGGDTGSGWVRERDHANVRLASPWEWPGFEIVRVDNTRPDQFYAHRVVQEGHATPDEQGALEQRGSPADSGSIFRKLYDTIDDSGDKKITSDEIRRALQKTWLAQALSHLIVEHESEWSGPMDKWNAIDELIPDNRKKDWIKEKERIASLLWWEEVKGNHGLPNKGPLTAFYFHQGAIIGNFISPCSEQCKVQYFELQTTPGPFRVSKDSFDYILETEQYQEFPYVPGGDTASGITIGYGYDLGHQNESNVRRDLAGIYTETQIDSFVSVIGNTRSNARSSLPDVSSISISRDNAMTLALRMKSRYADDVLSIYPEVIKFHPHCQGALLSLVINRGASLSGDRRREMAEIRDDFRNRTPENIPARIRSMKRLWEGQGQGGLLTRRDKEAEFFEEGLKCDCWE